MIDKRGSQIIEYLQKNGAGSSKDIFENVAFTASYATLKRLLVILASQKLVSSVGNGKSTKYMLSPVFEVVVPVDVQKYFAKEIDDRTIKGSFNFSIISDVLADHSIFSVVELQKLERLQKTYTENIAQLSENEVKKELERLAIDLSWKSSQIEGNTYSLLETERLLKEKETAAGKTKEEAIMLLNHKEALDFIMANTDYFHPLTIAKIEDIHSILIKDLAVERNLRKKRVGISGTNYRPLDNEFQVREALLAACDIINNKINAFEKALLALVLLSYIQPFMDGNKRTARIVCNAILIHEKHCPLSFRTVDSIEYKKAMLLFYEQNNITYIKDIFIQQFEFAVNTYF